MATWSVLIICVVECVVISYIYGVNRFLADIQAMVGYRPWPIWTLLWAFLTPVVLIVIIVLTFLKYKGEVFLVFSAPTSEVCNYDEIFLIQSGNGHISLFVLQIL